MESLVLPRERLHHELESPGINRPGELMKNHTEEQIIALLWEGEAGARVADLFRKYRDERRHLLQLEGEVRRSHRERIETPETSGR